MTRLTGRHELRHCHNSALTPILDVARIGPLGDGVQCNVGAPGKLKATRTLPFPPRAISLSWWRPYVITRPAGPAHFPISRRALHGSTECCAPLSGGYKPEPGRALVPQAFKASGTRSNRHALLRLDRPNCPDLAEIYLGGFQVLNRAIREFVSVLGLLPESDLSPRRTCPPATFRLAVRYRTRNMQYNSTFLIVQSSFNDIQTSFLRLPSFG